MESLLYFWYFIESKKSKEFNWQWINYFVPLHVWSKNTVDDKFPSLYWSSSEFFKIHLSSLEMLEVTRWANAAVWCSHPGAVLWLSHPLTSSCSPSHHTSFWLRVRRYFGLGESEWSLWLEQIAWCDVPNPGSSVLPLSFWGILEIMSLIPLKMLVPTSAAAVLLLRNAVI